MPEISNREHFMNGEDYYILTRENAMGISCPLEIPTKGMNECFVHDMYEVNNRERQVK